MQGLKELYRAHKESQPMAYIVGAEIYRHLEKVVDRFEDVADRISGILHRTFVRPGKWLASPWSSSALIVVALLFDFLNGLHDAANSIATIVSTRVLRPQYAVFWAAFFNFIAFVFFGLHVANTVGSGIVDAAYRRRPADLRALVRAPSSGTSSPGCSAFPRRARMRSSAAWSAPASPRPGRRPWSGRASARPAAAIVLSPLLGFFLALLLVMLVSWALRAGWRRSAVDSTFRMLQFVSASLYSLGHGGNDAQKTMGVIAVLLFSHGLGGDAFHVPLWVVLSCQAAMALGTLFGGWRIVHTMGSKITRLTPMQGFCAETGGAMTLFLATALGVPVSTTHTITGAIVGVGAARRVSAVRWNIAAEHRRRLGAHHAGGGAHLGLDLLLRGGAGAMIAKPRKARKKAKKAVKSAAAEAERLQYAALPWRVFDGALEIMLVSSRETKRWIIPKGWPMSGRSGAAAAAIEAMEEAGLLGIIAEEPFGHFAYSKRFSRGEELCKVEVFPLRVARQRDSWPEKHERETRWFPVAEAMELVSDPELADVIAAFARDFGG